MTIFGLLFLLCIQSQIGSTVALGDVEEPEEAAENQYPEYPNYVDPGEEPAPHVLPPQAVYPAPTTPPPTTPPPPTQPPPTQPPPTQPPAVSLGACATSLLGDVAANQLSASTEYGVGYTAADSRLDALQAWAVLKYDAFQWIQADLGSLVTVTGVITQGGGNYPQWLTSFTLSHSLNGLANTFTPAQDPTATYTQVFPGNADEHTHVTTILSDVIVTRFLRLHPVEAYGWMSLRWDVLGCPYTAPAVNMRTLWWDDCGRSKYTDAAAHARSAATRGGAKIINGQQARPHEFPWQVSLRQFGKHFCGAVIIHPYWVLTASHCVSVRKHSLNIKVGDYNSKVHEHSEQHIAVAQIFRHELFHPTTLNNDIALLLLTTPITFNADVQPACQPQDKTYDGAAAQVSGWGSLRYQSRWYPDLLQWAQLSVQPPQQCTYFGATDQMMCAGRTDNDLTSACKGDSGGPLVSKNAQGQFEIIGVVSWGVKCSGSLPTVFARVSRFIPWITNILNTFTPL